MKGLLAGNEGEDGAAKEISRHLILFCNMTAVEKNSSGLFCALTVKAHRRNNKKI